MEKRAETKRKPQRENKLNEICMSMSDNLVNFFKLPISRCIRININPKSKSPIWALVNKFGTCVGVCECYMRTVFTYSSGTLEANILAKTNEWANINEIRLGFSTIGRNQRWIVLAYCVCGNWECESWELEPQMALLREAIVKFRSANDKTMESL